MIFETERLVIRELEAACDAVFIFSLLNTPKFLKYIGDRDVRSVDGASAFIDGRYRASYHEHGFGLYAVDLKDGTSVGICGFVRRDTLSGPDLGFAFLPEHEGRGYGFESATAMLEHGRDTLGFEQVFAITSLDNIVSGKLLGKLGFSFERVVTQDGEDLNLYTKTL